MNTKVEKTFQLVKLCNNKIAKKWLNRHESFWYLQPWAAGDSSKSSAAWKLKSRRDYQKYTKKGPYESCSHSTTMMIIWISVHKRKITNTEIVDTIVRIVCAWVRLTGAMKGVSVVRYRRRPHSREGYLSWRRHTTATVLRGSSTTCNTQIIVNSKILESERAVI